MRRNIDYAEQHHNFKKIEQFEQIRGTSNHTNVVVMENKKEINVNESRGVCCLACSMVFLGPKNPNLMKPPCVDAIIVQGKL